MSDLTYADIEDQVKSRLADDSARYQQQVRAKERKAVAKILRETGFMNAPMRQLLTQYNYFDL